MMNIIITKLFLSVIIALDLILLDTILGYYITKWLIKKGYFIKMEKKEFKEFLLSLLDFIYMFLLIISLGILGGFASVGVKSLLGKEFSLLVLILFLFVYVTYSYFMVSKFFKTWWN